MDTPSSFVACSGAVQSFQLQRKEQYQQRGSKRAERKQASREEEASEQRGSKRAERKQASREEADIHPPGRRTESPPFLLPWKWFQLCWLSGHSHKLAQPDAVAGKG